MENTPIIAERIKIEAKKRGIKVKDILEYCQIDRNIVNKLANGKDTSTQTILKIAKYLDCSVDYLLGRTNDPNSHKTAANEPKLSLAIRAARSIDDKPIEIVERDESKFLNAPEIKL